MDNRPAISIRQSAVIVCLSAFALIAADQSTKRWAKSALSPGEFVPVVVTWLGFKPMMRSPLEIAGSPVILYVLVAVFILGMLALVAVGGVGRPLHAVALGLLLGAAASSLFDYVATGSGENFIALGHGPDGVLTVNLAIVAIVFSTAVLAIAAVTGGFPARWQTRQSPWRLGPNALPRKRRGR